MRESYDIKDGVITVSNIISDKHIDVESVVEADAVDDDLQPLVDQDSIGENNSHVSLDILDDNCDRVEDGRY